MKSSTTQVVNKKRERVKKLLIWLFWLGVWVLISNVVNNDILVANPSLVIKTFVRSMVLPDFWKTIFNSMIKISIGFLLAFICGIILGGLSYWKVGLRELLSPMISLMKSIPVASFVIIALIWIDSAYLSVFISFFVVFPMIYITVLEGLNNVDKQLSEMADVFRIGMVKKVRYVYVSEVLPFLIANVKVALGMCWKSGISAEIIGLPKHSIGEKLYLSKIYLDTGELFAWTIVIVLLSVAFEKLCILLLHYLERWITT